MILAGHALRPFLVTADPALAASSRGISGLDVFDAFSTARPEIVARLLRLDQHLHAAADRALPAWVLYDCALAPGAVVGFAAPPAELGVDLFGALEADDFAPVSFAMVIPTLDPACPLMHSLAAAEHLLPGDPGPGALLDATRELAEALLGLDRYLATVPWRSDLTAVFAARHAVRVLAARCPTHDDPETAVLKVCDAPTVGARPLPLDLATPADQEALQCALDRGDAAWLAGPSLSAGVLLAPSVPPGADERAP